MEHNSSLSSIPRGRSRQTKQHASNNPAIRLIMQELQILQREPNEGFRVKLVKEDSMFEWEVAIFGSPDTVYAGGYFRAVIKFPSEYPFSPPTLRQQTLAVSEILNYFNPGHSRNERQIKVIIPSLRMSAGSSQALWLNFILLRK